MRKNNTLVVIAILAIVIGIWYFSEKGIPSLGRQIPIGCDALPREEIVTNSFTCAAPKTNCEVTGTLTCNVATGTNVVSRACSSNCIGYDVSGNGILTYFQKVENTIGGQGQSPTNIITQCNDGKKLYTYNSKYYVYDPAEWSNTGGHSHLWNIVTSCTTAPVPEAYSQRNQYTCIYGFCKDGLGNYCTKQESSLSPWTKSTDTVTLTQGQSIEFKPKSAQGTLLDVSSTKLTIDSYSCTCSAECTEGAKKCIDSTHYSTCTATGTQPGQCNAYSGSTQCPNAGPCNSASNTCGCPLTAEYCTSEGSTQCTSDNKAVQTCVADGACFKWSTTQPCSGNNVCTQHSPAQCSPAGAMTLSPQTTYPTGHPISIPVRVISLSDVSGSVVNSEVKGNGYTVDTASCILSKMGDNYVCDLVYNAVTNKGTYQVSANVNVAQGIQVTSSASFNIYTGAGISIYADSIMYTHEDGVAIISVKNGNGDPIPTCSVSLQTECFDRWKVEAKVNGAAVATNLVPTEKAGEVRLTFKLPSTGSVYLKAYTEGGQIASVVGERTDIIAEVPRVMIEQSIPSTIAYGNNKFDFKLYKPSNEPNLEKAPLIIPTTSISIKVESPNGATKTINPSSGGNGNYYFYVDMPDGAGQRYVFSITANAASQGLQQTSTQDIDITAQGGVAPLPLTDWTIWIIAGLGVVLLIIIIVTRRRRR